MSADRDELTPLIQQREQQQQQQQNTTVKSNKRSYHVYGMSLGFLFLFATFIHFYRAVLPTPLSDTQAKEFDDFSGIHAYNEYLSHFIAPHSANTRENGVMRDWIASVSTDMQKNAIARGLQMDVIGNDTSEAVIPQDWFGDSKLFLLQCIRRCKTY